MARGHHRGIAEANRAEAFIDLALAEVKPAGAEVSLGYWSGAQVEPGDVIETAATGRRYLVVDARRTQGRDPHWALRCLVLGPDDVADGVVHPLHWFPRSRAG